MNTYTYETPLESQPINNELAQFIQSRFGEYAKTTYLQEKSWQIFQYTATDSRLVSFASGKKIKINIIKNFLSKKVLLSMQAGATHGQIQMIDFDKATIILYENDKDGNQSYYAAEKDIEYYDFHKNVQAATKSTMVYAVRSTLKKRTPAQKKRKVYVGKRGGLYCIKVRNGKRVKVYIS